MNQLPDEQQFSNEDINEEEEESGYEDLSADEEIPEVEKVSQAQELLKGNNYNVICNLSENDDSNCFYAINMDTHAKCAIKFMPKRRSISIRNKRQVSIFSTISHTNIIKISQYIQAAKYYIYVTPYYNLGDLYFALLEREMKFTIQQVAKMMWGLIDLLNYLHNRNIVHGNISLENIILESESKAILTGFSHASEQFIEVNDYKKTVFIAPEVEQNRILNFSTDIFALGTAFYFLLTECNVNITSIDMDDDISQKLCPSARNLLSGMLKPNPAERFGMNQIIAHEFFIEFLPDGFRKSPLYFEVLNTTNYIMHLVDEGVKRTEEGPDDEYCYN